MDIKNTKFKFQISVFQFKKYYLDKISLLCVHKFILYISISFFAFFFFLEYRKISENWFWMNKFKFLSAREKNPIKYIKGDSEKKKNLMHCDFSLHLYMFRYNNDILLCNIRWIYFYCKSNSAKNTEQSFELKKKTTLKKKFYQ